jgi:hypothetical protein
MLLLVAFTLFRPGYWLDKIYPPYHSTEPTRVYEVVGDVNPNGLLTMVISGPDFDTGEIESTTVLVSLGDRADGIERLEKAGLNVILEDGIAMIEEPFPDSPFFETIGKTFDFYADDPVQISDILRPADRMPKEVFYIPAVMLLALIVFLQRRRRGTED